VVPAGIYYQLLTMFAACGGAAFPVMYMNALMTRALYQPVFAAMHDLVMADLGRRPLLYFSGSIRQSPVAGFTTRRLC